MAHLQNRDGPHSLDNAKEYNFSSQLTTTFQREGFMPNDWRCSRCGNINPGNYSSCVKCRTPRPASSAFNAQPKRNRKWLIGCSAFVLGALLLGGLCSVIFLVNTPSSQPGIAPSTQSNETKALSLVQNWRPPQNKGMSCKEAFDDINYVYKNNLSISDARINWSVEKSDEENYIVHAALKGETGWANYSWMVNIRTETIISMDELSICPKSSP